MVKITKKYTSLQFSVYVDLKYLCECRFNLFVYLKLTFYLHAFWHTTLCIQINKATYFCAYSIRLLDIAR